MSVPSFVPLKDTNKNSINRLFQQLFSYLKTNPGGGSGGVVDTIVGGSGINVDATDPANPVVSTTGTPVARITAGSGVTVNSSDPENPIISSDFSLDSSSPGSVNKIWSGSQAQYDGLTPDANTLYFIVPW